MRKYFLAFLLLVVVAASIFALGNYDLHSFTSNGRNAARNEDILNHRLLREISQEAQEFCVSKNFNSTFCLLVNMSKHSGKMRFYVWDMKSNSTIDSSLVSHGCGDGWWGRVNDAMNPVFSNKDGSHCSSLGKYKVGKRDFSQWGIHVKYFLHGLDSTNSNALAREIVLHSWDEVKEQEVYPAGTPEGWGCPAVSNEFMKRLDAKLKSSPKPVLLWIFRNDI